MFWKENADQSLNCDFVIDMELGFILQLAN